AADEQHRAVVPGLAEQEPGTSTRRNRKPAHCTPDLQPALKGRAGAWRTPFRFQVPLEGDLGTTASVFRDTRPDEPRQAVIPALAQKESETSTRRNRNRPLPGQTHHDRRPSPGLPGSGLARRPYGWNTPAAGRSAGGREPRAGPPGTPECESGW